MDAPQPTGRLDAGALVLVTEWQKYRDLDWESIRQMMHSPVLLDGRNVLDRALLVRSGYRYLTLAG